MTIETRRRIPEELFGEKVGRDERRRNFYSAFPPNLEHHEPVALYPDINGEGNDWRFSTFNEQSGDVNLVVEHPSMPKAISAESHVSLLEFYLLNPSKAPADLKLPLAMYLDAWDARSPDSSEQFVARDGEIPDDTWEAIEEHDKLTDRKQNTLLSIEEARQVIADLNARIAQQRPKPAPLQDERQQRFAEYERLKRAAIFG